MGTPAVCKADGNRALKVRLLAACLALCSVSNQAYALGEPGRVSSLALPGYFALSDKARTAPLYVDTADWPGVARAVASFAGDVRRVTGQSTTITHNAAGVDLVVIGTLGRSALVDRLVAMGKLDVSSIRGHWEMSITQVVVNPFPGVRRALVIAGADKRGTIFGIYGLSEQIGVSPWNWWADVRVSHHNALYVAPERDLAAEPRVKYRGIFLNDEAPALSGWAQEKFGGINHLFYEHVFELLLRLRANYLWPAMWNNAFNEDDPADPKLADEYGIVMGTSHHEPMLRAQQEWKRHGTGSWDYSANAQVLDEFWAGGIERNREYESTITIGMRGDGDMAMNATSNTALLEKIVANQRRIIASKADPAVKNPQIWALYKEVQDYYEKGMRVPDDVTLLWCDDNWGNLRRLPTAQERHRSGGAGVYYHFDYVGDPRSYKWLLTYNLPKIWEQMHLAAEYGADRVWIVNVGDLKPMEFAIEFFLSMARDPERWNQNNLDDYTRLWATREFGPEHAAEIADLVILYTKYNARRKPEQLEPTTYKLDPGGEADRIERDWEILTQRAERVSAALPVEERASFFELVLYPLKASATVGKMYIAAGRNGLYARQGRTSANFWADETRRLFTEDAALSAKYNQMLDGKWNHMMDQTHIGYTYWQQPPANAMPAVRQVDVPAGARLGVFAEDREPRQADPPVELKFDSVNRQTRRLDLARMGTEPAPYTVSTSVPWIVVSSRSGTVTLDTPLLVSINWTQAPMENNEGSVTVSTPGGPPTQFPVHATRLPSSAVGFVEDNGVVTINAGHASRNREAHGIRWQVLPGFGETLSGMEAFPVTAAPTLGATKACLDYDITLERDGHRTLEAVVAPTLPFSPDHGLRFSVSIDAQPEKVVDSGIRGTTTDWETMVSDGVQKLHIPMGVVSAGNHVLHVCRIDPGVVLERFHLYVTARPVEYLGPPESADAEQSTSQYAPAKASDHLSR